MKQFIFALLLILCMTSCKQQQRRKYVSVLDNEKSLVNKWYGKDHFTENDELDKASLNKNDKQDSFESEAGQMVINKTSTTTTNPSSSTTAPQSNATNKSATSSTPASNATSALTADEALPNSEEKSDPSNELESVETVSQQVDEVSLPQQVEEEPEQIISKNTDPESADSVENKDDEI